MRRNDIDLPAATKWNVQRLLADGPRPHRELLMGISRPQRRYLRSTVAALADAGHLRIERVGQGTHYLWIGGPVMTAPPEGIGWFDGDPKSYPAIHFRLRRDRGKAKEHACVQCGERAMDWAYDGSDPDAMTGPAKLGRSRMVRYSLKLEHYRPLCRACHVRETVLPSVMNH